MTIAVRLKAARRPPPTSPRPSTPPSTPPPTPALYTNKLLLSIPYGTVPGELLARCDPGLWWGLNHKEQEALEEECRAFVFDQMMRQHPYAHEHLAKNCHPYCKFVRITDSYR